MYLSRTFILAVVFSAFAVGCKKQAKKENSGGNESPPPVASGDGWGGGKGTASSSPPAGWCEARDGIGGYRVFLPGEKAVAPDLSKAGGKELQPTGCYAAIPNPKIDAQVRTFSLLPPPGLKLGNTPQDFFSALLRFNPSVDQFHDVLEQTPITLGGKPALKVVLKKKPSSRPKIDVGDNPVLAKIEAGAAEREQKEQTKRLIYYVTHNGSRMILIQVDTPAEPDGAILKTVTDSFAFL